MSDVLIAVLASGATLTAVGAVIGVLNDRRHERRIDSLERRVTELEPSARHDRLRRTQADTGEAFLFNLVTMAEQEKVLAARIEYAIRLAEHVRAGGKPDDLK